MPNRRNPDSPRGLVDGIDTSGGDASWGQAATPPGASNLSWELPRTFLGADPRAAEDSRVVVLPVPYESTTSWGMGTRWGPAAILEASRYIELYDQELDFEIASEVSVATLPALQLTRAGVGEAMAELRDAYARVAQAAPEAFILALGGEHSVSAPMIEACARRVGGRLSVLQMDAHADLRDEFEGTAHSHASAMARVLPFADVVAVGLRGVSSEEVRVSRKNPRSTLIWAEEMVEGDEWMDRALEALGPRVYLTFDVDFLDPSIMPATGTPEPGGFHWYTTLRFLRRLFAERDVVAADIVELAPIPGFNAPQFTVAKLMYKLMGYRFISLLPGAGVRRR